MLQRRWDTPQDVGRAVAMLRRPPAPGAHERRESALDAPDDPVYHVPTTRIAEQRRLKPHARPGGMAACRRAVGAQRTDAP